MNKRILAFLLAVILAFSPIIQVNASGLSMSNGGQSDVLKENLSSNETETESETEIEPSLVFVDETQETESESPEVIEESTEECVTTEESTALEETTEDIVYDSESDEESSIYVEKQPERITELTVGESAKLQVSAKSTSASALKYQWYQTLSYYRPTNNATKIANATSAKLTVTPKKRGIQYYFCEISDGNNKVFSDCVAVVTGEKGFKVCSKFPMITSVDYMDKLDEDGWKWDGATKTLILNNIDLLVPFLGSNCLEFNTGTTVIVEGTNYINDNDGCILLRNSDSEDDVITTFKGSGRLITGNVSIVENPSGHEFHFTDGITVDAEMIGNSGTKIVLDNATYFARDYALSDSLVLQNGAYLQASNGIRVTSDVEIGSDCRMICGDIVECLGSFTIEEDAMVIIDKYLTMNSSSSNYNQSRILTINGTLHIKAPDDSYQPIELYSQAESPLVLGESVRVITPEGAVWDNKVYSSSSYYYGFRYNDSYKFKTLTIGKAEMSAAKKISGSMKISGKPNCGNVLKAGAVEQKNATVSYQWQYANKPNGLWEDIPYERDKTYTVESKYHGCYLRVITQGIGDYTGEIVSEPVGPVAGNDCFLSAIWGINGDNEEIHIGDSSFDGSEFFYSLKSDMTGEGFFRYYAEPVNEKATIIIRNLTTGFSHVGKTADVPVNIGENEIEIEVNYGFKSNVYSIEHEIIESDSCVFSLSPNTMSLTATWTDENGLHTKTVDSANYWVSAAIKKGTEITITSTTKPGTYPYQYHGLDGVPDKTKEGFPVTFILNKKTSIYSIKSDIMAYPPEGLAAGWQLEEGTAQIKVKALPIPNTSPIEYMKISIDVLDRNGEVLFSETVGGERSLPDNDGFHRIVVNGLDSNKQYRITAHNENINNNRSIEEQTAYYILEERKTVSLSAESEYVVLKPDETIDVPIIYNGYEGSILSLENDYDTNVVSSTETMLKTDAYGNRILQIKAVKEGSTYLTLRGEDYSSNDGMQYVFTSLRVDVFSADETPSFSLGRTEGNINLYDDSAIIIPVYRMECGHDIEGAEFAEASLNEKFAISVLDDRTLKVEPKVPADDGIIDFEKWVAQKGRTGTFTSRIKVKYNGVSNGESKEEFKITLTAKKPKIKVSTLKFNSFYTEQTKNVQLTVTGETVNKIQVDTAKNIGDIVACPSYITIKEDEKTIVFDGNKIPSDSFDSYIYLKIWPQGYRIPLQTKVRVKVSYQKPVIKFEKSTVSLSDAEPVNVIDVNLKLISGNKKLMFNDIGVKSIRCLKYTEFMQMSQKERKAYIDPQFFDIYSFDETTGDIILRYTDKPVTGKTSFYANIKNGKEPILVNVNIKVNKKTALKASKSTVILDKVFGSSLYADETYVKLSTNITGYDIWSGDVSTSVYMVGDKTNKNYLSQFRIYWDAWDEKLYIRREGELEKGTYRLYVYVNNIEKPAIITIKVIESKVPALSASKKEFSINRLHEYGVGEKTLYLSLPKKYDGFNMDSVEITGPDETTANYSLQVERISWDDKKNAWKYTINPTDLTEKGTYKITFKGIIAGGNETKPTTVHVKVTEKAPDAKITPRTITLNKDLGDCDSAWAELNFPLGDYRFSADGPWNVVSITDTKGKDASDKLDVSVGYGSIKVLSNENTEYGTTYKVKVAYQYAFGINTYDTLTVKIAKKNAPISIKMKATGSIDVARPKKGRLLMDITGVNWNEGAYVNSDYTPYYEWKVYAKNGNKVITTENGAINDEGLVASGTSLSSLPSDADWFYNSAPYNIGLMINTNGTAWKNNQIAPHYTYTLKATLKFPALDKEVKAPAVTFTLKQGTTKFVLNEKSVYLNKSDAKGRALITITDKNEDRVDLMDIECVEVAGDKKIPVSNAIEIVPLYQANDRMTYAIYWKDKTVSNVKSGTVKVNIYLKGNNSNWKKPNASFDLKVNVK